MGSLPQSPQAALQEASGCPCRGLSLAGPAFQNHPSGQPCLAPRMPGRACLNMPIRAGQAAPTPALASLALSLPRTKIGRAPQAAHGGHQDTGGGVCQRSKQLAGSKGAAEPESTSRVTKTPRQVWEGRENEEWSRSSRAPMDGTGRPPRWQWLRPQAVRWNSPGAREVDGR